MARSGFLALGLIVAFCQLSTVRSETQYYNGHWVPYAEYLMIQDGPYMQEKLIQSPITKARLIELKCNMESELFLKQVCEHTSGSGDNLYEVVCDNKTAYIMTKEEWQYQIVDAEVSKTLPDGPQTVSRHPIPSLDYDYDYDFSFTNEPWIPFADYVIAEERADAQKWLNEWSPSAKELENLNCDTSQEFVQQIYFLESTKFKVLFKVFCNGENSYIVIEQAERPVIVSAEVFHTFPPGVPIHYSDGYIGSEDSGHSLVDYNNGYFDYAHENEEDLHDNDYFDYSHDGDYFDYAHSSNNIDYDDYDYSDDYNPWDYEEDYYDYSDYGDYYDDEYIDYIDADYFDYAHENEDHEDYNYDDYDYDSGYFDAYFDYQNNKDGDYDYTEDYDYFDYSSIIPIDYDTSNDYDYNSDDYDYHNYVYHSDYDYDYKDYTIDENDDYYDYSENAAQNTDNQDLWIPIGVSNMAVDFGLMEGVLFDEPAIAAELLRLGCPQPPNSASEGKTGDTFLIEMYNNHNNSDKLFEVKCGGDISFLRVTPPFHVSVSSPLRVSVSSEKPKIEPNTDGKADFDYYDGMFGNEFKRALKRFHPFSFPHEKTEDVKKQSEEALKRFEPISFPHKKSEDAEVVKKQWEEAQKRFEPNSFPHKKSEDTEVLKTRGDEGMRR